MALKFSPKRLQKSPKVALIRWPLFTILRVPLKGQFRGFGVKVGRDEDLLGFLLSPPLLLLLLLLPPLAHRPLLKRSLTVKFLYAELGLKLLFAKYENNYRHLTWRPSLSLLPAALHDDPPLPGHGVVRQEALLLVLLLLRRNHHLPLDALFDRLFGALLVLDVGALGRDHRLA